MASEYFAEPMVVEIPRREARELVRLTSHVRLLTCWMLVTVLWFFTLFLGADVTFGKFVAYCFVSYHGSFWLVEGPFPRRLANGRRVVYRVVDGD